MGKAFLASLFVFCLNFLILIEVLPFRPDRCVATLLLAGLATSVARYVALREFGRPRRAAKQDAIASFVVVFLFYSCGSGLLLSRLFGRFEPFDVAIRTLFMLTFMTAWGFFRDARKAAA